MPIPARCFRASTPTVLAAAVLLVAATAVRATPGDDPDPIGAAAGAALGPISSGAVTGSQAAREILAPAPSLPARVLDAGHQASDLVLMALHHLGVPYRRGGHSEAEGFDCSGFTRHVVGRALGIVLPRRADDQARDPALTPVLREELQPGDLVFFNTLRRTFSHVGIYIGNHRFVHAPRPGSDVRTEDMRLSYWSDRYTGARRAPPAASTSGQTAREHGPPQGAATSLAPSIY